MPVTFLCQRCYRSRCSVDRNLKILLMTTSKRPILLAKPQRLVSTRVATIRQNRRWRVASASQPDVLAARPRRRKSIAIQQKPKPHPIPPTIEYQWPRERTAQFYSQISRLQVHFEREHGQILTREQIVSAAIAWLEACLEQLVSETAWHCMTGNPNSSFNRHSFEQALVRCNPRQRGRSPNLPD